MLLLFALLLVSQSFALAANQVHTGFNYGAFWQNMTAKTKSDFVRQFKLAQSLPAPIPFNSARLFTCKQFNTNKPIQAFEAAIETNTSLLLGFWNPGSESDFKSEMAALEAGFELHKQALADLVVGISIGNEDIHRWDQSCDPNNGNDPKSQKCTAAMAATSSVIQAKVQSFRSSWETLPYAKYFKAPPPIGHVDIAAFAGFEGNDFIGMNAYPYWHEDGIDNANKSYHASIEVVKKNLNNAKLWLTETGWPYAGNPQGAATAGTNNMQRYWSETGCSLFGKYNTWWFQLESDTIDENNLDWAIAELGTGRLRINLDCPGLLAEPAPRDGTYPSSAANTVISESPSTGVPSVYSLPAQVTSLSVSQASLQPSSPPGSQGSVTLPAISSSVAAETGGCITVGTFTDGQEHIIASNPPGPNGQCSAPPPFNPSLIPVTVTTTECVTEISGIPSSMVTNPPGPDGKCVSPPPYVRTVVPTNPLAGATTLAVSVPTDQSMITAIIPSSNQPLPPPPSTTNPDTPLPALTDAPTSTLTAVILGKAIYSGFTSMGQDGVAMVIDL